MRILALDLSSKTGWALSSPHGSPISGVQEFRIERGESPGMRFLRFRRWLTELCFHGPERAVDCIAYEMPFARGGHATQLLFGFSTVVLEFCAKHEIEHVFGNVTAIKRFATGKGHADKAAMLEAARQRWPDRVIETDDEADALWLLAWAIEQYAPVGAR